MNLGNLSFHNAHVLCVGDLMLDHFVYGTVNRISPEAPVPVLKTHRDFFTLGGVGNVVRNLSTLGCQVTFVGVVGDDQSGEQVTQLLNDLSKVETHLAKEGRTSLKSRFIADTQQLLRVDDEIIGKASEKTIKFLKKAILSALPYVQGVILSDYGKGLLSSDLCQFVISEAKLANVSVIVDPKGEDYSPYEGATLVTPNAKELADVSPFVLNSEEAIEKALGDLKDRYHLEAVLVTRGAKGMSLLPQDQKEVIHLPTQAQEVFDVSGAGDTVIATLSAAVCVGMKLEEAARLANIAAGIVVGKVGTATVTHEELKGAVLKVDHETPSKIMSLADAKNHVQNWRRKGLAVGFTNGCFDLLHLGHLHSLEQCRKVCDRLVIGLNSDASIQRLKGESRPIQSETVRSHVLAALEYVDCVIVFEDDTPLKLIETLLPDVLCKGADYTIDQIVGADVVRRNGGKVHLIDLKPGYSTTATVKKLQGRA